MLQELDYAAWVWRSQYEAKWSDKSMCADQMRYLLRGVIRHSIPEAVFSDISSVASLSLTAEEW